jgi:hypothetical protein
MSKILGSATTKGIQKDSQGANLDILLKDLEQYNPTIKSVLRVERLFRENIEFDSKNQILRKLEGSMKAPVLNVILKYLKGLGKILDNEDGSWTWIYAANNEKLKNSYKKAAKL